MSADLDDLVRERGCYDLIDAMLRVINEAFGDRLRAVETLHEYATDRSRRFAEREAS